MSNISDAIQQLSEILDEIDLTPSFHYEPATLGDDVLGSGDHRAYEIIPSRTLISRDEGQGRGHIQTSLEVTIKWRIQFYDARSIYKDIEDELSLIERTISYAVFGEGILGVLVENWEIQRLQDPEVLTATIQLTVLTDEGE